MPDHPGPIPQRCLLLHIGVYKSGTTALQNGMLAAKPRLTAAGVDYWGPASWQWTVLKRMLKDDAPEGPWETLRKAVTDAPHRAMVSNEDICAASDADAERIIAELGAGRPVRVMITVRPIARLLASSWQQRLKRGMTQPYEEWLVDVQRAEPTREHWFWRRNDFPGQVARWGALVGEQNVIVALTDKREPRRVLDLTEDLLDLDRGTIEIPSGNQSNYSMSYPQAELLRQINAGTPLEFGTDGYWRLVRGGAFPGLYRSVSGLDAPIPLPEGVATWAAEVGERQAEGLQRTQATLVGDMRGLAEAPDENDHSAPTTVSIGTAAASLAGALKAGSKLVNA